MKAAIYSRPSAVSLKVWLRETSQSLTREEYTIQMNKGSYFEIVGLQAISFS